MSEPAPAEPNEVTRLLEDFAEDVPGAQDRLFALIYQDLHRIASRIGRERPYESFRPTELVNEAYLRIAKQRVSRWNDRAHFFGIAATLIRRVLVDAARLRRAQKRDGGGERRMLSTTIDASPLAETDEGFDALDILALDEALEELAAKSAPRARVVELRFFAGLSVQEVAETMAVHEVTVKRHWRFARTWLLKRMGESTPDT